MPPGYGGRILDLATLRCYNLPPHTGEKMTTQSPSDRLDRVKSILNRIAERQGQADQRQDRTDQTIAHLAEVTDKLIARNAEQIAQLAHDMNFLRAAVQGHISQSTPPTHSANWPPTLPYARPALRYGVGIAPPDGAAITLIKSSPLAPGPTSIAELPYHPTVYSSLAVG